MTERYNWTRGRSPAEVEQLAWPEAKRLFYLAARRAGEEGHECLAQHRAVAKEALAFWNEYWQRAVVSCGLEEADIAPALEVLESPHFETVAALWTVIEHRPDVEAGHLIETALRAETPFTSKQVLRAFRAGHVTWKLFPNVTPVTLLTVRLPIVDPANTTAYLREAERALDVLRLNRTWYSWVEHHRAPTNDSLDFYRQMQQEFAKRQYRNNA